MTSRPALRLYRCLLRLLPREFRTRYGGEMEEAFVESLALTRRRLGRGGTAYALFRALWDVASLGFELRRSPTGPRPPQRRRGDGALADVRRDLRIALRRLARAPAFTVACCLTLALGMGATVVMLTVVDAVLRRPLPYAEPERLVAVFLHEESHGARRAPTSPVNFSAWRSESENLTHLTAAHPWAPSLTGTDRPDELPGLRVSPSLFPLLGVPPLLGRALDERDEASSGGAAQVVVLGFDAWRRRFGQDPSVVGRNLTLDGEPYVVVGVMPEGFRFPPFWSTEAEMWAPLPFDRERSARHSRYLRVFARLASGVSVEEARREMEAIGAGLVLRYPEQNRATSVNVEPLLEPVVAEARPALVLLLTAVLLLALIACANVANLQLVRRSARAKEVALAAALGAGRARLLREAAAESLFLAAGGGLAGALLAIWGVPALVALAPEGLPRLSEISVDHRLLLFALAISAVVALLLGLLTTPRTFGRDGVGTALREPGARATSARGRRLRDLLAVSQVATSVVLLIGAGLVVRSFLELRRVDPGFRQERLLTSSLLLAGSGHATPERQSLLFRRIREAVGALPGVGDVALINHLPIGGDSWGLTFGLEGAAAAPGGDRPRASQRTVTPGYFRTMGVPLLAGRDFAREDDERSAPVVVVNRTLAERFASVESIVGRRILIGSPDSGDARVVVGVVADSRQWDLTEDVSPEIYFPYAQNPQASYLTTTIVVLNDGAAEELQPGVERAVWSVAGRIPVTKARTMEKILSEHVAPERFASLLFAAFAALALVLAAVGLYGVLSYAVSQQTAELGIRAALGASRGDLGTLVLVRGARLVGVGIALGLGIALVGGRFLSGLLFGVSASDPTTFAAVPVFAMVVALGAAYFPARRASRLDPLSALRNP